MSHRGLTLFIEEWQEPSKYTRSANDLTDLLLYTQTQTAMMAAINELHALSDGIDFYRNAGTTFSSKDLPALLIRTMESRERAKRLYRTALMSKVSDSSWDMDRLFDELEEELLRSTGVLRLYQKRGGYH